MIFASDPSPRPQRRRRKGAVLVLALAVVALAGAAVLQSHLSARNRINADRGMLDTVVFDAAIEDAVLQALTLLAEDADPLADYMGKPWTKSQEIQTPSGINLFLSIEDANRRFDLNNLHTGPADGSTRPAEDMLADLLLALGDYESTEHAATLRDWVDPGDDGPRERRWYEEMGRPQRPPNRPLTGMGELVVIPGFTRELLDRKSPVLVSVTLADHLTVIPFARTSPIPINVNTAQPEVLRCILGPAYPAISETILSVRDRNPLVSLDALLAVLPPLEASTATSFFSVRSDWFMIRVRAYKDDKSRSCLVLAHRNTDGAMEVKQWVN